MRQNVGIIYSDSSRQAHCEDARRSGALYRFRGPGSTVHWVRGEHAYLAVNGLASLLRRLAIHFDVLPESDVSEDSCRQYTLLFIPNAKRLEGRTIDILRAVVDAGVTAVVSGATNLPDDFLGVAGRERYVPRGFLCLTGIAWGWPAPWPVSPPGYAVYRVRPGRGAEALGSLLDLQNPEDAAARRAVHLDGAGLVRSARGLYVPFPLFEFVGGLLQSHLDLGLARDLLGPTANFYLDRVAVFVRDLVRTLAWEAFATVRVRPWGAYDSVLVLRHDTDDSRDTTYLDFERERDLPATYAILLDHNWKFWRDEIAEDQLIERAFHFPSNRVSRFLGLLPARSIHPNKTGIARRGLARGFRKAAGRLRQPLLTGHRHAGFFYYPETIAAIAHLYQERPDLLGLSTMFRFTCFRYSRDRRFASTLTVRHPDVSVPLWFPFRLQFSACERHESLRGWDSSAFIEPDPQMMDLIVANSEQVTHGTYALIFHPAHARGAAFAPGGNLEWFVYAVEQALQRKWLIASLASVYRRLSEWEGLRVREEGDQVYIQNALTNPIKQILVEARGAHRAIELLPPGETAILSTRAAHVG